MKLTINKSYKTKYTNPILLKEGDVVILGAEEKEVKWQGWIWATFENISGWIPKQIVKNISADKGIVTDNYSARELDVEAGDSVFIIKELNGWYWVRHLRTNEEGWIPKEITE